MKQNWTYKKLTDVCDIQYGYPFNSAHFSDSPFDGMPLIRIRDVKDGQTSTYYKGDYPQEYIIHKGDYLVGMDGEFNIAPWKSDDALLNQRVCKISSKNKEVYVGYLYRFLSKELKKIEDETPFVTVKHLSAKRLNQVSIPVPPLSTQSRIVSELDLLQSIIDKQKAQLKELDNLAQAVFYDMFGDPVENEKGWERIPFESSIQKVKYTTKLQSKDYLDSGKYPIISQEEEYISGYWNNDEDLFRVVSPVVIFGDHTRILKYVDFSFVLGADGVKIFLPISAVTPWYLYYFLKSSNIPSLGYSRHYKLLKELTVPIPPLDMQQSFTAKIESIEKQKAAINQSIAETQKLFDYTMDKYFG